MSQLTDYTPDEVSTLVRAPLVIGMMVVGASLSGPFGVVKELLAAFQVTQDAAKQAPQNSALRSLFSNQNMKVHQELMAQEKPETMDKAMQLERIRQAIAILGAKGNATELEAYKTVLLSAAENTANAAKEGGFLGIGGQRVSEAEQVVIEEIRLLVAGA